MSTAKTIFVAGHKGMVGSALTAQLSTRKNISSPITK